eukprot:668511-Amphidinium_carterae.2
MGQVPRRSKACIRANPQLEFVVFTEQGEPETKIHRPSQILRDVLESAKCNRRLLGHNLLTKPRRT